MPPIPETLAERHYAGQHRGTVVTNCPGCHPPTPPAPDPTKLSAVLARIYVQIPTLERDRDNLAAMRASTTVKTPSRRAYLLHAVTHANEKLEILERLARELRDAGVGLPGDAPTTPPEAPK